jgi:hypothetical protein
MTENNKMLVNNIEGNYIGEIRKGKDINRSNLNQNYKWNPCPSCGSPKWSHICNGEVHHTLCKKCVLKRSHKHLMDKTTGKIWGIGGSGIPNTRFCNKCQRELPLTNFYKGRDSYLGVRSMCIECGKVTSKEYRKTENGKNVNRKSAKKYYYTANGRKKREYYNKSGKRKSNLLNRVDYYDKLSNKPITKICVVCKNELPFSCFRKMVGGKYNLRSNCKECDTRLAKEYKETEHGKEVTDRYRKSDRYKQLARINNAKFAKTEKYINYHKQYKKTEKSKQKERERAKLPEYKERKKKYYKTEKGKAEVARWGHRRRVRDKSVPATLTLVEWEQIKKRYKYKCVYCGKKEKLTRDHIIPLSKGGGLTKENVVPACKSCNSSKLNKPVLLQILAMVG